MKNKYWLMIVLVMLTAQMAFAAKNDAGVLKSSATMAVEQEISTIAAKDVKNYKTFLEYANKTERLAVKAGKPAGLRSEDVVRVNRGNAKFELSLAKPIHTDAENKQISYLGADKQVAIYDVRSKTVSILDASGRVVREGVITPHPRGVGLITFSDTRIFEICGGIRCTGGVKIFDYKGNLLKEVNPGTIFNYAISHNKKYLAVTSGRRGEEAYFILYAQDGTELLREQLPNTTAKISFTRDDDFVAVKIRPYCMFNSKTGCDLTKSTKVYVIDVLGRKVLSNEEEY